MQQTKRLVKQEWKVYFEAVMLEIRNGFFKEAEESVKASLVIHNATGRLWATLIQLQHARSKTSVDFEETYRTFIKSLNEIPKSGEVWCEGARLHMNSNPCNQYYDLDMARKYLEFAIQFTPQYGDSFLEMLKLTMILPQSHESEDLHAQTRQYCIHAEPNYGVLWFYFKNSILDNAVDVWRNAEEELTRELPQSKHQVNLRKSVHSSSNLAGEQWMASQRLIRILRSGMREECRDLEEHMKIVYGFEQILPSASTN